MPLPASGPISMSQMNAEFAKGTSLSQYYSTSSHPPHLWRMNIVIPSHGDNRANVPSSGSISFSNYHKKRNELNLSLSGSQAQGYTSYNGTWTFIKQTIYNHRFSPYWGLPGIRYVNGGYLQVGLGSLTGTGGGVIDYIFNISGTSFAGNCQSSPFFHTLEFQLDGTNNTFYNLYKFQYLQNGTITYDPGTNAYLDKLNKSASSGLGSSTYAGKEISSMYITRMQSQIYDFGYWLMTNQSYSYKSYSGNCPAGVGSNQHNDLTPDSINIDAWFSYLSTRGVLANGDNLEIPLFVDGNRRSRAAMSMNQTQTTSFRGYSFSYNGSSYNPAHSAVENSPFNISFNGVNYVWNRTYGVYSATNATSTGGRLYHLHYSQVH